MALALLTATFLAGWSVNNNSRSFASSTRRKFTDRFDRTALIARFFPILNLSGISKSVSSFFNLISHIIKGCSKIKMFNIYARRVITGVTNIHTIWYFTSFDYPDVAMSTNSFPPIKLSTVFVSTFCPCPKFTFIHTDIVSYNSQISQI